MHLRNDLRTAWGLDEAVFCVLALSLCLPSGYSIGAGALLLLGLLKWPALLRRQLRVHTAFTLWALAIFVMALVWSMHIVDAQGHLITSTLGLDRSIKYVLVLLTLPVFLIRAPRTHALRWGCALGALGAALIALFDIGFKGLERASGYTNAIQFGNLALLLGVWSGIWALHTTTWRERWIGWIGAALGLIASLASGSRGGWITLPLLVLVALWLSRIGCAQPTPKHRLRALGVTVLLCLFLGTLPPVQNRMKLAVKEWQRHDVQDNSSVELRKSFWHFAWNTGLTHPWLGVGQAGYEQQQREAAAQHLMSSQAARFNHAHNEWLDMFAKRGILGILGLLCFYLIPGVLFARILKTQSQWSDHSTSAHAAALCGLTTVIGFFGFGMTQVMFAHNNGNLMYLLAVSIWLCACCYSSLGLNCTTLRATWGIRWAEKAIIE